jgi:hypothetical protein
MRMGAYSDHMSTIHKYIEYLKDNPQGYWFKRKLYGWGWVPATWQGWAVIAAAILYIVWVARDYAQQSVSGGHTSGEVTGFIARVAIAIVVLLAVCYWKGEEPKWQWGFPKE